MPGGGDDLEANEVEGIQKVVLGSSGDREACLARIWCNDNILKYLKVLNFDTFQFKKNNSLHGHAQPDSQQVLAVDVPPPQHLVLVG